MIKEKTINICGKEVSIRYCAATETGFEQLSGKSSDIFTPKPERDSDGNIVGYAPLANMDDYIKLSIAAIIAAYSAKGEDAPVTAEDVMYNASSKDISGMLTAVIQLRNQWYDIPSVVKPETEETSEPKNA